MKLASTYYQILGISPTGTTREIKLRYRELVRLFHPDVSRGDKKMAEQIFVQINVAYRTLRDEEKRRAYDEALMEDSRAGAEPAPRGRCCEESSTFTDRQSKLTVAEALAEAEGAFLRGNLADAQQLCRRILEVAPNTAAAHKLLADTMTHTGLHMQALRHYTAAAEAGDTSRILRDKIKRMRLIYGES
jgi:curved DNA-binding protein CbpA